jgi:hypothetical protein
MCDNVNVYVASLHHDHMGILMASSALRFSEIQCDVAQSADLDPSVLFQEEQWG